MNYVFCETGYYMKKIFSILLALIMIISFPVHAQASEFTNADSGYVYFIPYSTRITSGGYFHFDYGDSMESHCFYPISGQITMSASARIYNRDTGGYYKVNDAHFTISIVNANTGVRAGYLSTSANGRVAEGTYNVSTGVAYKLVFTCSGNISYNQRIVGEGDLSNIRIS